MGRPHPQDSDTHRRGESGAAGRNLSVLVLASASPRRADLLRQVGLSFVVDAGAAVDEALRADETPRAAAERIARDKAAAAAGRHPADAVVLGADTMVVLDGRILGKPSDAAEAARMLRDLAGREHEVVTGWALTRADRWESGATSTRVRFRGLADREIATYVATGEPLDKAGAYGIQGRAALFVERIAGDYGTVVGLPLAEVGLALDRLGFPVL